MTENDCNCLDCGGVLTVADVKHGDGLCDVCRRNDQAILIDLYGGPEEMD